MNEDFDKGAGVSLRPVVPEDEAFLLRVYATTRVEELELTDWDVAQKQAFVTMQFLLQRADYEKNFASAQHDIILLNGEQIGRMMVDRTRPDEIRGVDIAILPEYRSSGVGTQLINALLAEASARKQPFRIQVTKFNRAIRLYERLGFVMTGETPTHFAMEWLEAKEGGSSQGDKK